MKFLTLFLFIVTFACTSFLYAIEASSTSSAQIFKGCAKCHGLDGKNAAFGRSDIIAGQDAVDLMESMMFFKESEFSQRGVTLVMAKQVKNLSKEQIEGLAIYISKLGKAK